MQTKGAVPRFQEKEYFSPRPLLDGQSVARSMARCQSHSLPLFLVLHTDIKTVPPCPFASSASSNPASRKYAPTTVAPMNPRSKRRTSITGTPPIFSRGSFSTLRCAHVGQLTHSFHTTDHPSQTERSPLVRQPCRNLTE